jgi:hypothetical protein
VVVAVQISEPGRRALYWLLGLDFPGTDEDKLHNFANAMVDVALRVDGSQQVFVEAVRQVEDGVAGQSAKAFARKAVDLVGVLDNARRYVRAVGGQNEFSAATVLSIKVTVLTALALVLAEFWHALSMLPWTPTPLLNFYTKLPFVRAGLRMLLREAAMQHAMIARVAFG